MAAPISAFAQLPSDSGNTGKKMRTQSRIIGADTVHEHFFVQSSTREMLGSYVAHSGVNLVQASAQTFPTAFWWFINPVGNTTKIALTAIEIITQLGSALAAPTSPRLLIASFTFTGTASGAQITPGKLDSTYPATTASLRTASTGLTITKVADLICALPIASATAVGYTAPMMDEWFEDEEKNQIILRAGEGVALYQPDAGTASDTRRIVTTLKWDEFN
jgi:hypothetical protein